MQWTFFNSLCKSITWPISLFAILFNSLIWTTCRLGEANSEDFRCLLYWTVFGLKTYLLSASIYSWRDSIIKRAVISNWSCWQMQSSVAWLNIDRPKFQWKIFYPAHKWNCNWWQLDHVLLIRFFCEGVKSWKLIESRLTNYVKINTDIT